MFRTLRLLEAKNVHSYCAALAKMLAGKPTPTELSWFALKNILKSQHENIATLC